MWVDYPNDSNCMKKYCSNKNDIPTTPHWAIVSFSSIFIPGDERSKSCPGHGYPDSTETSVIYYAFDNEQEWKSEISKKMKPSYGPPETNFVAMKAMPATISTEVSVKIS